MGTSHLEPETYTIKVTDKQTTNIQWVNPTVTTDFPVLTFDQDLTTCLEGAMDSPTLYFEEDSKKLSLNNITTDDNITLDCLDPNLESSFDLNSLIASQANVDTATPQLFPEGVLLPETSLDLSGAEQLTATTTSQMPVVQVCTKDLDFHKDKN